LRLFRAAVWFLVALASAQAAAAARSVQEYEVKAAFLYNFTKFIEWPADAFARPESPLVIGIVGQDPFGSMLDHLVQGKSIQGRPLVVRRISWGPEMRNCHLLFVSASEKDRLGQMEEILKGAPVVTVSEVPGFARYGGIFNFILEDNRVHFEVNIEAVRKAHVTISSRLLSLAKVVRGSQGGGG
jgi:YfiR/HmsC-like